MSVASDQNRRTPPWLFKLLQRTLGVKFRLDAAASKSNALCRRFYDERQDGLSQPWRWPTFCNPPHKHFGRWVAWGHRQATEHKVPVCLVGPAGCSQAWFHAHATYGTTFVPDQRLVFFDSQTGKPTHGARQDYGIYVFGPGFWNKVPRGLTRPTHLRVVILPVRGLVVTSRGAR